jgi:hypothetical protein
MFHFVFLVLRAFQRVIVHLKRFSRTLDSTSPCDRIGSPEAFALAVPQDHSPRRSLSDARCCSLFHFFRLEFRVCRFSRRGPGGPGFNPCGRSIFDLGQQCRHSTLLPTPRRRRVRSRLSFRNTPSHPPESVFQFGRFIKRISIRAMALEVRDRAPAGYGEEPEKRMVCRF